MTLFVIYQRPIRVVLGLVSLKGDCLWLGFVSPPPPGVRGYCVIGGVFAGVGVWVVFGVVFFGGFFCGVCGLGGWLI